MHGGVGAAAVRVGRRGSLGVLLVVNAFGGIRDPSTGLWVAGARDAQGRVAPPTARSYRSGALATTLGLVVTDLKVERPALARIVAMAHAGLASVIVPSHSPTDGDVLFGAATGTARTASREPEPGATADRLGFLASELAVRAALGAVRVANAER